MQSLKRAWTGIARSPAWRLHQVSHPDHWHCAFPVNGKMRRMSSISFDQFGLVGVDIKSHQVGCAQPFESLVAGNEAQDVGCASAISVPPL